MSVVQCTVELKSLSFSLGKSRSSRWVGPNLEQCCCRAVEKAAPNLSSHNQHVTSRLGQLVITFAEREREGGRHGSLVARVVPETARRLQLAQPPTRCLPSVCQAAQIVHVCVLEGATVASAHPQNLVIQPTSTGFTCGAAVDL